MSSAKINGIDVHYQSFGEGETIVFAHGAGGNLLSWWQQIPFFSQNYHCVTIDQRGFGHSFDVPGGPGAGAFVEDLVGLLDHLEIDSAHLVAQSMGGRTMLGFAVACPQRTKSLVMADTAGGMAVPRLKSYRGSCGTPIRPTFPSGTGQSPRDSSNETLLWLIYTCRYPSPTRCAPNRPVFRSKALLLPSLAACKCRPCS